jgi:hypothetical protein
MKRTLSKSGYVFHSAETGKWTMKEDWIALSGRMSLDAIAYLRQKGLPFWRTFFFLNENHGTELRLAVFQRGTLDFADLPKGLELKTSFSNTEANEYYRTLG